MNRPRRIVVCLGGASGSIYARRTLTVLIALKHGTLPHAPPLHDLEIHWVASDNAVLVWQQELGEPIPETLAGTRRWAIGDFSAPFASGSNAPDGVIVIPCSMSTLARVAHGGGGDLIARTCDVALKERKRLVLVARETPLSLVHLRNMVAVTEAGAIVLPAVPSFYSGITTLEQAVDTVVGRALDRVGLEVPLVQRWGDPAA